MKKFMLVLLLIPIMLYGCTTASHHAADVQKGIQGDGVTVGTVQREIKKGMSGAEVISALGSPNIVSTDEEGREVWIYDKISTDRVYSKSSGGIFLILGSTNSSTGAASTSQKTLTIIIKFDHNRKVRDFAYHSSRF